MTKESIRSKALWLAAFHAIVAVFCFTVAVYAVMKLAFWPGLLWGAINGILAGVNAGFVQLNLKMAKRDAAA